MHLEAARTFGRLYQALPKDLQERVDKTLALLEENPSHPSLRRRKMAGQTDIYEISVSMNYRITYQKLGDTAYLRKVGTPPGLTPRKFPLQKSVWEAKEAIPASPDFSSRPSPGHLGALLEAVCFRAQAPLSVPLGARAQAM